MDEGAGSREGGSDLGAAMSVAPAHPCASGEPGRRRAVTWRASAGPSLLAQ